MCISLGLLFDEIFALLADGGNMREIARLEWMVCLMLQLSLGGAQDDPNGLGQQYARERDKGCDLMADIADNEMNENDACMTRDFPLSRVYDVDVRTCPRIQYGGGDTYPGG
jgi:hypothetical protein